MGTNMKVERFSTYTSPYFETKHFVDDDFIATYGAFDPVIPTGKSYHIGADQESLHVFLNGQRIFRGHGYEEVDDLHIKLHTGGMELLPEQDYIYIEVHENYYCSSGSSIVSGNRFLKLEQEIAGARGKYPSIDIRINEIQKQLVMALTGQATVKKEYIYNSKNQVTNEIISGDVELMRVFSYYTTEEDGRLEGEIYTETVSEKLGSVYRPIYRVTRYYDPMTRRLLREEVMPL